ncbi:hypothetical protein AWB82_00249 [Caballeronia glebae]|uniref:Peptidase M12A domain-containing protein n=1 Tax=Caballeronia glebae TaxID=1777143 RepID=A0A157Z5Q9_9BURK|nr:hypothetical protein AWB82_00249 [Caballeronia glebae]
MFRQLKIFFICCLAVLMVAGCGDGSGTSKEVRSTVQAASTYAGSLPEPVAKGYALSTNIWPTMPIPVCWMLDDEEFARTTQERAWTRSAVEETWVANSGAEFAGWNQCGPNPRVFGGLRIGLQEAPFDGAFTIGLGTETARWMPGMRLKFTFYDFVCINQRENCIKFNAVHEFGHALGFSHEQNRDDTPASCKQHPQGGDGDTKVGAWDLDSVMNYCNPISINSHIPYRLSAGDVAMVQKFYGKPRTRGTIYSLANWIAPVHIAVFDLATHTSKPVVDLSLENVYKSARQLIKSGDGTRLLVTLTRTDNLTDLITVDTASNTVINVARTDLPNNGATQIASSRDGSKYYAYNATSIRLHDARTGELIKEIKNPPYSGMPNFVREDPNDGDSLYVSYPIQRLRIYPNPICKLAQRGAANFIANKHNGVL